MQNMCNLSEENIKLLLHLLGADCWKLYSPSGIKCYPYRNLNVDLYEFHISIKEKEPWTYLSFKSTWYISDDSGVEYWSFNITQKDRKEIRGPEYSSIYLPSSSKITKIEIFHKPYNDLWYDNGIVFHRKDGKRFALVLCETIAETIHLVFEDEIESYLEDAKKRLELAE